MVYQVSNYFIHICRIDSTVEQPKVKTPINIEERFYIERSEIMFDRDGELGRGGSAVLLKGDFKNCKVAIKKHLGKPNRRNIQLLEEEASMLLSLNHPNIVTCHGLCKDNMLVLVLEQAGVTIEIDGANYVNHSLRDLLDNYQALFPFLEVGLYALHQVSIVYFST